MYAPFIRPIAQHERQSEGQRTIPAAVHDRPVRAIHQPFLAQICLRLRIADKGCAPQFFANTGTAGKCPPHRPQLFARQRFLHPIRQCQFRDQPLPFRARDPAAHKQHRQRHLHRIPADPLQRTVHIHVVTGLPQRSTGDIQIAAFDRQLPAFDEQTGTVIRQPAIPGTEIQTGMPMMKGLPQHPRHIRRDDGCYHMRRTLGQRIPADMERPQFPGSLPVCLKPVVCIPSPLDARMQTIRHQCDRQRLGDAPPGTHSVDVQPSGPFPAHPGLTKCRRKRTTLIAVPFLPILIQPSGQIAATMPARKQAQKQLIILTAIMTGSLRITAGLPQHLSAKHHRRMDERRM